MKSVKEISEELEVSKQTVFNNIKRLNIETIKRIILHSLKMMLM